MSKGKGSKALGALVLIAVMGLMWYHFSGGKWFSDKTPEVALKTWEGDMPVKGMATLVDLGSNECLPCKMMAPILERVTRKYEGKAAVLYVDVLKNKDAATRFGVRAIPTQIFFDEEGQETYRHEGFMGEEEIHRQFQKMGVALEPDGTPAGSLSEKS